MNLHVLSNFCHAVECSDENNRKYLVSAYYTFIVSAPITFHIEAHFINNFNRLLFRLLVTTCVNLLFVAADQRTSIYSWQMYIARIVPRLNTRQGNWPGMYQCHRINSGEQWTRSGGFQREMKLRRIRKWKEKSSKNSLVSDATTVRGTSLTETLDTREIRCWGLERLENSYSQKYMLIWKTTAVDRRNFILL